MEKLSKIQAEMKAPKGQFNSFGKYKYRSCEDIIEAVKPFLDGARIHLTDEMILIGDRYYVKATAVFIDGDNQYSVSAFAREEESKKGMDGAQVTGSASSYARKYALNGLLLIDDQKDADTDEHQNTVNSSTKSSKAKTDKSEEKKQTPREKMYEALRSNGLTPKEMSDLANFLKAMNKDGLLTIETMIDVAERTKAYINEWREAKDTI
jgi:hypothetical protein